MVLVSGIICLIVQSFLVLRVWKRESSILRVFSLSPNRSLAVFSPKSNCSADEITFFSPFVPSFVLLETVEQTNSEPQEHCDGSDPYDARRWRVHLCSRYVL